MRTIRSNTDPMIPALSDIRNYLQYDPDTGVVRWIRPLRNGRNKKANRTDEAGHQGAQCIQIGFRGVSFKAHRLAWALHYGEWPTGVVDHINRDPYDNRISNLRMCSQQHNTFNSGPSKNSTSGFKGVWFRRDTGRWAAEITHNRKKKSLGCYPTAELAAAAYDKAAKEIFGEFASPNHNTNE
jgi:hypothetical protein